MTTPARSSRLSRECTTECSPTSAPPSAKYSQLFASVVPKQTGEMIPCVFGIRFVWPMKIALSMSWSAALQGSCRPELVPWDMGHKTQGLGSEEDRLKRG
jgi:hypothetical protein